MPTELDRLLFIILIVGLIVCLMVLEDAIRDIVFLTRRAKTANKLKGRK